MGTRYRKSINLGGGFRINLSKSGIGYSWGTKGYRKTKLANGRSRTTYSIPGTGLSYVEETSNKKQPQPKHPIQNNVDIQSNQDLYDIKEIKNSNIEQFKSEEFEEFRLSIEKALKLNYIANIMICSIILIYFGIPLKIYVRFKSKINLDYEMDNYYNSIFNKRVRAWELLSQASKVWNISKTSKTNNQKYNAGASTLINRENATLSETQPFYLNCNKKIFTFKTKNESIIILPDVMLLINKRKVGVVSLKNIDYSIKQTRFIEEQKVPTDAQIIDQTWKYVNKNGSPDKRMKNNHPIPICAYAEIQMKNNEGLNIILQCSNLDKAKEFINIINNDILLK